MKHIPKEIYLQIGTERDNVETFNELHGVTWSAERINNSDIKFVLADVVAPCECDHPPSAISKNKDGSFTCVKCGETA